MLKCGIGEGTGSTAAGSASVPETTGFGVYPQGYPISADQSFNKFHGSSHCRVLANFCVSYICVRQVFLSNQGVYPNT
jgi:hypothetical protein